MDSTQVTDIADTMTSEFLFETIGGSEASANAFTAVRLGSGGASTWIPNLEELLEKEPDALGRNEGTEMSPKKKRKNHRGGQKKKNKREQLSLAEE